MGDLEPWMDEQFITQLWYNLGENVIVKIIRDIEAETGWGACWRIRDLEVAWGYSVSSRRDTTMNQHFSTSIDQRRIIVG